MNINSLQRLGVGRQAEVFAWGQQTVLKLFWEDCARDWIEGEARYTRIAGELGLPACQVGEIIEIGGRTGIVFERVDGPSMLQALEDTPTRGTKLASILSGLHASMHARSVPGLPSQRHRLIERIDRAPDVSQTAKGRATEALAELPDGTALCHGDFHPYNVILAVRRPAIIDWGAAMCGNPLADVARTLVLVHYAVAQEDNATLSRFVQYSRPTFSRLYLGLYCRLRRVPPEAIEAWELPILVASIADFRPEERRPFIERIDALLLAT